jgi:hypothetical protein
VRQGIENFWPAGCFPFSTVAQTLPGTPIRVPRRTVPRLGALFRLANAGNWELTTDIQSQTHLPLRRQGATPRRAWRAQAGGQKTAGNWKLAQRRRDAEVRRADDRRRGTEPLPATDYSLSTADERRCTRPGLRPEPKSPRVKPPRAQRKPDLICVLPLAISASLRQT